MQHVGNEDNKPTKFKAPFNPEEIAYSLESQKKSDGLDTMVDPLMKTVVHLLDLGCHKDMRTKDWRVYNPKTGLWETTDFESIRYIASVLLNKMNKVPRGKMKMIPRKYMDDFWFQIVYDNPRGMYWDPANTNFHHYLPFQNKVLDLTTRTLLKYHKEMYLESKIERIYDASAGCDCPDWIANISHLADHDAFVMKVLEAFAFLSMCGKGRLERSVLSLYSELGGSGKGTYMNALSKLVGENRHSAMEISRINDDTLLSYIDGKTLVTFPEEREILRSNTNAFARVLKMASLDPIRGRKVHSPEEFTIYPKAMMVFSSNYHVFPSDGAGSRRVLMIKSYPYPDEERDLMMGVRIEQQLPQITNRILEQFDFNPQNAIDVIQAAADYKIFLQNAKDNADETSSVAMFIKEMLIPVCAIKEECDITPKEYKENGAFVGTVAPCVALLSLYEGYKYYLSQQNPGAKPLRRSKFERELIHYYKLQYRHELHIIDGNVPGLPGNKLRVLGINFNPDTWIDEYKIWRA